MLYTGWPKKNATPTINDFKKTRERINKLSPLLRIIFFQQDDNKIINFDKGVLILRPYFCGNVIFKMCHFCLKSHNCRPKIFHCLASPIKVSALALKNEDSMNKEKHSLRNSAVLQSGEGTQRNSSLPQSWLLIQKKQVLKWHCFRKMALDSKHLHQNHWSWYHLAGIFFKYAIAWWGRGGRLKLIQIEISNSGNHNAIKYIRIKKIKYIRNSQNNKMN